MKSFRLFKAKKGLFLILDFGENSVKGLLLEKNKNQKTLRKMAVEEIEEFGVFEAKDFKKEIIGAALSRVLERLGLIKKGIGKLETIISLPANVSKASVIEVSLERGKEEECINKKEEEKIKEAVGQKISSALSAVIKRSYGKIPGDFQIIKEKTLETRIAGYRVPVLTGFRGKSLSFKMLVVFVLRKYVEFISQVLKEAGIKEYQVCHQVEGLIEFKKKNKDGSKIFIDIGGLTSQVFVVNHQLENVSDFEMADRHFSKAVQEKFGLTFSETKALKELSSQGRLSQGVKEKLENALLPFLKSWVDALNNTLEKEMKRFHFCPDKLVVFGGGSLTPCLKEMLEKRSQGGSPLKVLSLKIEEMGLVNKTGLNFSAREISLALLALVC